MPRRNRRKAARKWHLRAVEPDDDGRLDPDALARDLVQRGLCSVVVLDGPQRAPARTTEEMA